MSDSARLLLVGAAAATRDAFAACMAPNDIEVVADAAAALAFVHQRAGTPPRLIVMSAVDASAAEAIALIKGDPLAQMVPLLVCTSGGSADLLDGCYGAGANACVAVPSSGVFSPALAESIAAYWMGANEVPPPA